MSSRARRWSPSSRSNKPKSPHRTLGKSLCDHVGLEIGKFAKPARIRFADALPKTRSGKIMRRLLRDLAAGHEAQGDMTTLEDIGVLAALLDED